MTLRTPVTETKPPEPSRVRQVMREYAVHLPQDRSASILDIGFGDGWFCLACSKLGYTNVQGADFSIARRRYLEKDGVVLHEIKDDIGHFLTDKAESYDFIHMSHVIEHIPKYSLLWVGDALYRSLRKGGKLFLRTPNMEGPTANSSYYVTLAHEYGFAGSNLESLLNICGFDEIAFHSRPSAPTFKGRIGDLIRRPFVVENRMKHRLFGVNTGGQFGSELIVTALRRDFPPFFDPKFY